MSQASFDLDVTLDERTAMPERYDRGRIEAIIAHALAAEGAAGPWEIAVVLTSDAELQALHRDYLDDDTPTDIMTFPFETVGDWAALGAVVQGGDIAISVERAAEQRSEDGWDTATEMEFLVLHGVLHLLGWDDRDDAERSRMLNRQRGMLESFAVS